MFIQPTVTENTVKISGGKPKRLVGLIAATASDGAIIKGQTENGTMSPTFNNVTVNGTLTAAALTTDSVAPAITALAGGGQSAATALTKNLNIVTTVATAADSVTLPAAAAGLRITIVNLGANALAIFPYTSDSINDVAVDNSVTQDPETTVTYNCYTGVLWQSDNESLDAFDKIYTGDGTVSLPALTFMGDKDSGVYRIGANNVGVAVNAAKVLDVATTGLGITGTVTVSSTTASTTKDTGSIVTEGGVGVEKEIYAGLSINAGTYLTSGDGTVLLPAIGPVADVDTGLYFPALNTIGVAIGGVGEAVITSGAVTLSKEVTHVVTVATTTTAATVGGSLQVKGGTGATSGAGGAALVTGGAAGATAGATGGAVTIAGGSEGAGAGITGAVNISTPAATGGAAGNITLLPGTSSSTTIAPVVILGSGVVAKSLNTSVATGATATAVSVIGGHLSVTGATGTVTLPTAADLTTAIGATPVGTRIEFVVNTIGMTAGNVCTIAVGANIVTQKMISAGDSATDQLLTVTNTSNVNMGIFRLCYITATTCSLHRIG